MNKFLCCFEPIDTWFFREARPHDAAGGQELSGNFPPPARTLAGALRTQLGEALDIDWAEFNRAQQSGSTYLLGGVNGSEDSDKVSGSIDAVKLLGCCGDDLGALSLTGPFLKSDGELLFPAPAFLVEYREPAEGKEQFGRLTIAAKATRCDLGKVRLPQSKGKGAQALQGAWLKKGDYETVLAGKSLASTCKVFKSNDLFDEEARLGIGRGNEKRVAQENLLYQTRHVRLREDLCVVASAQFGDLAKNMKLNNVLKNLNGLVRLGGEGRLARLQVTGTEQVDLPQAPPATEPVRGLILTLLTAARFEDGQFGWVPLGFEHVRDDNCDYWSGEHRGVKLRLVSAVMGKPLREGGWDLAKRAPKAVVGYVPAGSAYFCEIDIETETESERDRKVNEAIAKLHGSQIGNEQALGRGLLAVGLWLDEPNNHHQKGA